MAFSKDFTEAERATLDAAFGILHDAMVEAGEEVIMMTAEVDTGPGEPPQVLISHFIRGTKAMEMVARGFTLDTPIQ